MSHNSIRLRWREQRIVNRLDWPWGGGALFEANPRSAAAQPLSSSSVPSQTPNSPGSPGKLLTTESPHPALRLRGSSSLAITSPCPPPPAAVHEHLLLLVKTSECLLRTCVLRRPQKGPLGLVRPPENWERFRYSFLSFSPPFFFSWSRAGSWSVASGAAARLPSPPHRNPKTKTVTEQSLQPRRVSKKRPQTVPLNPSSLKSTLKARYRRLPPLRPPCLSCPRYGHGGGSPSLVWAFLPTCLRGTEHRSWRKTCG